MTSMSMLPDIGLEVRVFTNGPGDLGSIPGRVIPKTQKMVLDGSRVKWSNPRKGVAPSPTPWCSKLLKREPSDHPRLWSPTYFLCQWRCHARDAHQKTFGSVWAGVQRLRTVGGQLGDAGIDSWDGMQWKQGRVVPDTPDVVMWCVLPVWEACQAPPSVWLALCGLQNTQEESKFGHKWLGWWDEGYPPPVYDVQDCGFCAAGWSGP